MAASRFRRTLTRSAAAFVALVLVAACGDGPTGVSILDTRFGTSLGVDLDASTRTATGLYYRDIVVGTGTQATASSTVTVRYELYQSNGQRREGGTLAPFTLGTRAVIDGFDEGIRGMRVGGTRQLIVPPHLGYRDNTIMVFTIELLNVT
ncbi:MAG: FKBP-type peptidyl-prolyl cis-trans isomerase [Gemmatimonadaceae bacterium]|nr:FKBP-type peptidyl-prolyl cis-trans isomerase [Gemmatimonadaceae bacterium]